MKKRLTIITALLLLICAVCALTSCDQWKKPYDVLDKEGASISVKFLAGTGGMFAGTNGVTVVDVFNVDDYDADGSGNVSIPIIAPNDKRRGNDAFEISRSGHILAGWYVTETAEDGTETLRKWDFEKDRLTVDSDADHTGNEPALTLTAMWVPYTNFVFYAQSDNGFVEIGSYKGMKLDVPEWDLNSGKFNYKNFATISGKTLDAVYLDEAMTQPMTAPIEGKFEFSGSEDSLGSTINVYTTWLDGEWFKISNISQLKKNASVKGCYELLSDLDFTTETWPQVFIDGTFRGQIKGNGHTINGIATTANITKKGDVVHGAIFGTLSEDAVISDLNFENITYTVKNAFTATNALFGVLAGKNNGAALTNVTVASAKITIAEKFLTDSKDKIVNDNFEIGLIFAEGDAVIFDTTKVTVELENPDIATVSCNDSGKLIFTFAE